jgi:hypothetical protein
MDMGKSLARELTGSPQRARLEMLRGLLRASDSTAWMLLDEKATLSVRGHGKGTEAGPVAELAWEIAMTAQSCALLAVELQERAEYFERQASTSQDSTCRSLSISVGIFRGLLMSMLRKFASINRQEGSSDVCVMSADLEAAILSMWAADNLTITAECMTSTERVATSDTGTAGGMK